MTGCIGQLCWSLSEIFPQVLVYLPLNALDNSDRKLINCEEPKWPEDRAGTARSLGLFNVPQPIFCLLHCIGDIGTISQGRVEPPPQAFYWTGLIEAELAGNFGFFDHDSSEIS